MQTALPTITVQGLNFYYGEKLALSNVNIDIARNQVTALIGPSGCGKSTFLRCLNRMNDRIANTRVEGQILFEQQNIYSQDYDLTDLRRRIGMVFQKPNPFPKSVRENVAYGPHMLGITSNKDELEKLIQKSLTSVGLWDELKDHLHETVFNLSLGQQQRLCLARVLAVDPEVILMDEPASALDPIATSKLEELIFTLKDHYTIVIVTHNMQQAARNLEHDWLFLVGRTDRI